MIVVLDTNIFVQDFWMKSTNWRTFINGKDLVPVDLRIPELVVDETVNKYKEFLNEKIQFYEKTTNELNRFFLKDIQFPSFSTEIEVVSYGAYLGSKLTSLNNTSLPYPEIKHKEVVKSILERKKPFKKGDAGYRDYLILQSIFKLEISGIENIIFITQNKNDFGDSFLTDEFPGKRTWNRNIRVYNSLDKFNEEFIKPRLNKFRDINSAIKENGLDSFDFKKWFTNNFKSLLPYYDLEEVLIGFPYGVGRVTIENIQLFKDYQIDEINEFDNGEILIDFSVDLTAEVAVSIDWDDYLKHDEVRN